MVGTPSTHYGMIDLSKQTVIRTIGLYQPFATMMLYGKIETRWVDVGRKAPFPLGTYLFYSCKKEYDMEDVMHLSGQHFGILDNNYSHDLDGPHPWGLGSAGAIGQLVSIIDPLVPPFDVKTFIDDGKWKRTVTRTSTDGKLRKSVDQRRIGLVFRNVTKIVPFPITGKQGVGFLDNKYRQQIQFA